MWAGLRAPKRIQLHRRTADKKHLIWAKYSVTSYQVVDLVFGRQTTRFKEPLVPSAVHQHQPSQSQRQTSVPLVCSSATITMQVPFPAQRHHYTLERYSTGTTSKRLRPRGSQAPSHNRHKSSTNSPLTDLEHSDALVPHLRRYRSRKAPSAVDQPVLKHHQSRSPLPHTKSQSAKESMPCISSPPMRHPRPTHTSGSLSCLERF
jgi:hypothetical protein